MAINTRFIQVHPDAVIEWIWDDSFFYEDEYSVIKDTLNGVSSFAFNKNATNTGNYNKIPQQLYLIDKLINKYGIADPDVKTFLQESKFANNQPSRFDQIKIWFPIHYTFPTSTGFYLKLSGMNYENTVPYNFANYFLDITVPGELNKIINETQPFRLNEKLWGKSITINIPSLYDESRERTNNLPTLGTINYNLTNGELGLSQTSPISIDFRFLSSKQTILGETTYILTPPLITNIPQAPEYNNLAVNIEEATDGDYYLINGLFNSSIGEFEIFMDSLAASGRRSYILYSITTYEENLPQDTIEIYVYADFLNKISFRPILKFTSTSAAIRVDMKLINAVDNSVVTKTAEIALLGNTVSKYGKYVTPINISGAIKPKIYNSKPDQLVLSPADLLNSHLRRKNNTMKTEIKYVPYPVLTTTYNIVAQDTSVVNNITKYLGFGELELIITPFDNIVKIKIANKVNQATYNPFVIPSSNSITQLVFKSATTELRIPLYMESNEVDLAAGVVVFKISSNDQAQLKKIYQTNKTFYITITTNGIETVIYDGIFSLLQEQPRVIKNSTTATITPRRSNAITEEVFLNPLNINLGASLTPPPILNPTLSTSILENITKNQLNVVQLKRLK